MFAAWGHFVHRRRWPVLMVSVVLLGLSIALVARGGTLKSGGLIQTSESGRAAKLIQDALPPSGG